VARVEFWLASANALLAGPPGQLYLRLLHDNDIIDPAVDGHNVTIAAKIFNCIPASALWEHYFAINSVNQWEGTYTQWSEPFSLYGNDTEKLKLNPSYSLTNPLSLAHMVTLQVRYNVNTPGEVHRVHFQHIVNT
jgi:hypothetical protein